MMIPYPHQPPNLRLMPPAVPVGSIIAFAGKILQLPVSPPDPAAYTAVVESQGWMVCDGRKLKQARYGVLYAALGNQYNTGSEKSDEFSIPDYRGYFLRMIDPEGQKDPDAGQRVLRDGTQSSEVGSIQEDAFQVHEHNYTQPAAPGSVPTGSGSAGIGSQQKTSDPVGDNVRTSTETRPRNMYVYYLIKFI